MKYFKKAKRINNYIDKCNKCGNNKKGGAVIVSQIKKPKQIGIMFVAQNPGSSNENKKIESSNDIIPFDIVNKNYYNRIFYDIFEKSKYKTFYFTNLVKCLTKNNKIPSNQQKNNCYSILKKEIKGYKPKKIIFMGKSCKDFFNQDYYSVHDNKIFVYHPGYLIRNKKEYQKTLNFIVENE